MKINEIKSSPKVISASKETNDAVQITAKKLNKIAKLPVIKQSRDVRLLNAAKGLYQKIQKNWNVYDPAELSQHITDLVDKVSLIKGKSVAVEKMRKVAEKLYFQFVFPVALELNEATDSNTPFSFARTVYDVAEDVFVTQSLLPMGQFNAIQNAEIIRYARGDV